MDNLKTYAAPIIALVILLVWFFVVRPMLAEPESSDPPDAGQGEAKASSKSE